MEKATSKQEAHHDLAHIEICEAINSLGREGIEPRVILAALATACADLIVTQFGKAALVPWFEDQAKILRASLNKSH